MEIGVAYQIYAFVHSRITEIGMVYRIYAFSNSLIMEIEKLIAFMH